MSGRVPFRPVRLERDTLVSGDERLPTDLRERLIAVLDHYGIEWQERDGALLVPPEVAADDELRWNYTTKALDAAWPRP